MISYSQENAVPPPLSLLLWALFRPNRDVGEMMRHLRPPPSFTIDRKKISVQVSHGIRIIEASTDKPFTFSLKKESLTWLHSTFSSLIEAYLNQKFFIKSRLVEYDLWVEKITNRKGHFAKITKLGVNGGLNKLILLMVSTKWQERFLFSPQVSYTLPTIKQRNNPCSMTLSYKDGLHKQKMTCDRLTPPLSYIFFTSPTSPLSNLVSLLFSTWIKLSSS